jgi:DNA-binding NarL/FixJ family response regulator
MPVLQTLSVRTLEAEVSIALTHSQAPAKRSLCGPKQKNLGGVRMKRRHVYLLVHEPMYLEALVSRINETLDFKVCGANHNGKEALKILHKRSADIVLVDLFANHISPYDFMTRIRMIAPKTIIVAMVGWSDSMIYERAERNGARICIARNAAWEKYLQCLNQASGFMRASEQACNEKPVGTLLDSKAQKRYIEGLNDADDGSFFSTRSKVTIRELSNREFQIFELMSKGLTTKDIGEKLFISTKTVQCHQGRIKSKLKMSDITQLRRFAVIWSERLGRPRTTSKGPKIEDDYDSAAFVYDN